MAHSMEAIAKLLSNTRFRKRLFGGVNEDDVWKKLGRLQQEYQELIGILMQQNEGALNEYRTRIAQLERERATWENQTVVSRASPPPVEQTAYPSGGTYGYADDHSPYQAYQRPQQPHPPPLNGQASYPPVAVNGHPTGEASRPAYQRPDEFHSPPPGTYQQAATPYVPRAMRYQASPQGAQPAPAGERQQPSREWQHWMRPPGNKPLEEPHG